MWGEGKGEDTLDVFFSFEFTSEMEKKADTLLNEAEKVCSRHSFLDFFSGDRYDKARDIFIKSGTCYKACEMFLKAANAYERAADMSVRSNNEGNMILDFEEAARCYAKAKNTPKAVQLYTKVVGQYEKSQMYVRTAKTCISLSEITEGSDSITWLEKAAEYYRLQGSRVTADDLMRKVADAKVGVGDYEGARKLYERLACETLNNTVTRSGARRLFFMALLAQLATVTSDSLQEDVAGLRERFETYQELDTQFDRLTREHMLVAGVIEAIEEESLEKMEKTVMEYEQICAPDELKKKMLLSAETALRHRLDNFR